MTDKLLGVGGLLAAAVSLGVPLSDGGYYARKSKLELRPAFQPSAAPEPLTKRQKRRLRGKRKP